MVTSLPVTPVSEQQMQEAHRLLKEMIREHGQGKYSIYFTQGKVEVQRNVTIKKSTPTRT